jgi:hypothetical protein
MKRKGETRVRITRACATLNLNFVAVAAAAECIVVENCIFCDENSFIFFRVRDAKNR